MPIISARRVRIASDASASPIRARSDASGPTQFRWCLGVARVSPSPRTPRRWTHRPPPDPPPGWCRPTRRCGQLRAGLDDPGDDQRERHVPHPPSRAQQTRRTQRLAATATASPCGRERFTSAAAPSGHQGLPGQRRPDSLERVRGQRREVRQRLVLDLAAVAVGPPQQVRQRLARTGLRHVLLRHLGYVHPTRSQSALKRHAVLLATCGGPKPSTTAGHAGSRHPESCPGGDHPGPPPVRAGQTEGRADRGHVAAC